MRPYRALTPHTEQKLLVAVEPALVEKARSYFETQTHKHDRHLHPIFATDYRDALGVACDLGRGGKAIVHPYLGFDAGSLEPALGEELGPLVTGVIKRQTHMDSVAVQRHPIGMLLAGQMFHYGIPFVVVAPGRDTLIGRYANKADWLFVDSDQTDFWGAALQKLEEMDASTRQIA